MRNPIFRSQSGFTLIELLVVVAIIGLLANTTFVALANAREGGRDARRHSDIKQIMTALELYYQDNGEYPDSLGATTPNASWSHSGDDSWDSFAANLAPYISSLPVDPLNNGANWLQAHYSYYGGNASNYGCPHQWYMLVYSTERSNNLPGGVATCSTSTPPPNGIFNYGDSGGYDTVTTGVNGIRP